MLERSIVVPASLSDVEIADELIRRRAVIDRFEAEFARLAWAGHQRGIGAADGSPSTQAWLRRHTGMREGDARSAIDAGAMSELLPKIGMAWRDGEITSGAAKTIAGARVDGHDLKLKALEDVFLDLARAGDDGELRRACAHFRNCARADGSEPRHHDGLTMSQTYNGTTVVQAELSSTAAEPVVNAIHTFTDPPTEGDDRTAARRRPTRSSAWPSSPWLPSTLQVRTDRPGRGRRAHRDRLGPVLPDGSGVASTASTPARCIRRMSNGSSATAASSGRHTGPDGLPLDVGRSRRTIPPQLRRALAVRDGGCRYPGCTRPFGWTDAHHVIHWKHGGHTNLANLVLLCDPHHHVVHQQAGPSRSTATPCGCAHPTARESPDAALLKSSDTLHADARGPSS